MAISKQNSSQLNKHLIRRIYVKDLFETYTYDLQSPATANADPETLLLLYGNNGAGKTTILNLVFHLLNPEPYDGHRTFVGSIPFSFLEIELNFGVTLTATRDDIRSRRYDLCLEDKNDSEPIRWSWFPDRGRRPDMPKDEDLYDIFCQKLNDLDISFHYLRDTRRIEGAIAKRPRGGTIITGRYGQKIYQEHDDLDEEILSPNKNLQRSISKVTEWFRQQALSGTNIGSSSVNSIYIDLIKTITTKGEKSHDVDESNINDLLTKLFDLKKRNEGFAQFGLTAELDIKDITNLLESADSKHAALLKTVLNPYLDGHNARLDALEDVQQVMSSFVNLLSDFYSEKRVNIHLRDGLQILSNRGAEIPPIGLSSGEKQLLLLLCYAVSARKPGTIFVIDEPEISLNVKWQRQLIPALLTCLGKESQLILATHSIELLSQYSDYVTPLENLYKGE